MAVHRKLKKSYLEAIAAVAEKALYIVTSEQTATNGTISVDNGDGTTTVIGVGAGTDETGSSNGTAYFVGDTTPPSVPTGISFTALDGSITGIWDGTLTDGVPADFDRIVFRADGSQFGTVNTAGSASSDAFETGTAYSCDAVAVDVQGNVSDPCDAAEVTVRDLAAEADAAAEAARAVAEDAAEEAATAAETAASAQEAADAAQASADAAATAASELASTVSDVQTTVTDLATTVTATAETATEALELATSVETSLAGFEVTVSETYATKTELADVEDTADTAATDAASALEQVSTLSVTVEGVSATASSAYTTAAEALTNAATAQATADAITTKVESDYTTTADLTEMLGSYVTDTTLSATLESYSTTEQTADAITSAVSSALYTTDTDGNTTAIYATSSEVEQTATEILSTVSATYATAESLSSYATVSYVDQTADEITAEVASTYATKGELEEVDEKADAANATAESAYAAATALLGTCATAASTAAKVVTCEDFTLFDGAAIAVTFTYANTAGAITLNVNGTGALSVYVSGGTASTSNYILWSAGTTVEFVYDGTYWLYAGGATSYKVTCGTAAATAAKTATQAGAVVCKGTNAVVTWTYGSSYEGAITFNLGSTAAKTVYYGNAATSSTNVLDINATETFELVFSGAYWYVADSASLTRNATLAVTVDEIDASVSEVYETTGYTLAEIADLAITAESITSTVSSTYATVDSLSDYATVDYVDEGDDVTIGGRNLLPDTRDMSTWSGASTYVTETDDEGYGIAVFPEADSLSWRSVASRGYGTSSEVLPYSLVRDKTVTFSVDIMVPGGEVGSGNSAVPYLEMHVTSGTSDTSRDVYRNLYSTSYWGISYDADDLTSWQRATYTFTITDSFFTSGSIDEFSDDCGFGIALYAYTTYEVRYRRAKLEIGDVATDWSPAPEDAETYTDDAVSTATTTITAAYTSAISQSASDILEEVSATYLTSDDAEDTYVSKGTTTYTTVDGILTAISSTYATSDDLDDVSDVASTAYSNCAYGKCATAASTQAKTVTCSDFTRSTGSTVTVSFTYANTYVSGATTLNVNSTGAASIYASGAVTSSSNQILWAAGAVITFTYDGTYWRVADSASTYTVTCSTAVGTTAKTASQTAAVVIKGTTANVTFTYGNTASAPTFNLASTVADSIYTGTTVTSSSNPLVLNSGTVLPLVWTGSYWRVGDTFYSTIIRQTSDGVTVGKIVSGSYTGTYTLMDDEGFHIMSSDGETMAVFDSDELTFYQNGSEAAYIQMNSGLSVPELNIQGLSLVGASDSGGWINGDEGLVLTSGSNGPNTSGWSLASRAEIGGSGLSLYSPDGDGVTGEIAVSLGDVSITSNTFGIGGEGSVSSFATDDVANALGTAIAPSSKSISFANSYSAATVYHPLPHVWCGGGLWTASASSSLSVFTSADFSTYFIESYWGGAYEQTELSSMRYAYVQFSNGDGSAQSVHVDGATYLSSKWYAVFGSAATAGSFRINFLVVRP